MYYLFIYIHLLIYCILALLPSMRWASVKGRGRRSALAGVKLCLHTAALTVALVLSCLPSLLLSAYSLIFLTQPARICCFTFPLALPPFLGDLSSALVGLIIILDIFIILNFAKLFASLPSSPSEIKMQLTAKYSNYRSVSLQTMTTALSAAEHYFIVPSDQCLQCRARATCRRKCTRQSARAVSFCQCPAMFSSTGAERPSSQADLLLMPFAQSIASDLLMDHIYLLNYHWPVGTLLNFLPYGSFYFHHSTATFHLKWLCNVVTSTILFHFCAVIFTRLARIPPPSGVERLFFAVQFLL